MPLTNRLINKLTTDRHPVSFSAPYKALMLLIKSHFHTCYLLSSGLKYKQLMELKRYFMSIYGAYCVVLWFFNLLDYSWL